jgi:hypothetical protein
MLRGVTEMLRRVSDSGDLSDPTDPTGSTRRKVNRL